jgi:hypothetical protein
VVLERTKVSEEDVVSIFRESRLGMHTDTTMEMPLQEALFLYASRYILAANQGDSEFFILKKEAIYSS